MTAAAHCIICGSTRSWPVGHARNPRVDAWRREAGQLRPYEWLLCRDCGNGFPSEQPDRGVLARFWAHNRETDPGQEEAQWAYREASSHIGARRTFALYAEGRLPGRFLDIACGLGRTVRHFADRGWAAEGIDADPTTFRFHQELGIRSRIGQVEEAQFDGMFDLVQVAYAIYFVTDPRAFMASLRCLLAPGGRLAIVISDMMQATLRPGPTYAHTFYPTSASMLCALEHAGYAARLLPSPRGSFFIEAVPASVRPRKVSVWGTRLLYATQRERWLLWGAPRTLAGRLLRALHGGAG